MSDLSKLLTIASFLVIDLSDLLTVALLSWVTWAIRSHRSLKKRDWENRWFFKNNLLKKFLKIQFYSNFLSQSLFFCKRMSNLLKKTSDLLIHSFIMSPLSKSFTVALLSWVTWAICSQSLICPEQSEPMSDERMSKFPTLYGAHIKNLRRKNGRKSCDTVPLNNVVKLLIIGGKAKQW